MDEVEFSVQYGMIGEDSGLSLSLISDRKQ